MSTWNLLEYFTAFCELFPNKNLINLMNSFIYLLKSNWVGFPEKCV